jgi:hypothetical protein
VHEARDRRRNRERRGLTGGPRYRHGRRRFDYISNSNEFELLQNLPKFDQSKNNLPLLENFEIKYDFESLEKMNNFLHIKFLRFSRNGFQMKNLRSL